MNGGRMVEGIVRTQVAFGAEWRVRAKALQAGLTELKTTIAAREV